MLGELRHFGELLTRNARLDGNALGLCDDDLRTSWRQAEARTNRLAHALRARGIDRGDRVAIFADNRAPFVETLFAAARLGAVTVPVNSRLNGSELCHVLDDAGAKALFTDVAHLETARDAAGGSTDTGLVIGYDTAGSTEVTSYARLLEEGSESPPPLDRPIEGDDLLILLYTSGTTGFPKGVMYSHRGALLGTLIHVLAIASHRRHRVMLPSPLYSAAGFAGIACAIAVGSPCHIVRFTVETALETLARERITFTNLVPTTVRLLLDHPARPDHDLSALEVLLYGGSPMPEPTLRDAARILGCDFRQTFATSETGLSGTVLEPEDHRRALDDPRAAHLLTSCGTPQVGVGVRVLGESDEEQPRGEIGEIAVACEANMVGYWNRPDATAAVLRDGWLRTGDLARMDEQGFVYLVDRKHDMIVTGALNVYPTEVERILASHPAVADCAVAGVPHPTWGEAVTAFVVARDAHVKGTVAGSLEQQLVAHCRRALAGYKTPKVVHLVDAIPRNPAGKPLRRQLRSHVPNQEAT